MSKQSDDSFEALAVPHLDAVYRVARRLTRDENEAEDLVQDTFLKAQRAFGRFELRSFGIKPWLLRILHNAFLNQRARERHAPRSAEQEALEQAPDERATDSPGPPELDYERVDEEVKNAVENLRPEFKTVLLLWALMELSYKEIADVLGIPLGTVMSRLFRARQQICDGLRDYARENRLAVAEGSP